MSLYRVLWRRDITAAKLAFQMELGVRAERQLRDGVYHVHVPASVPLTVADRIMTEAAPGAVRVAPANLA